MKISRAALPLAAISAVILLASGLGARFGIWEFSLGFLLMRVAFFAGLAAAAFALLLLIIPKTRSAGAGGLVVALILGLVTAWIPWSGLQTARSVPPIHDITTDMINPPAFVDVVPLRADARNPVDYAGEEIASQQREAYPDIRTLTLAQPAAATFTEALAAAEAMGWEIVAAESGEGRIEGTATTRWFGFKDDVVIRITPTDAGSQLDIRSKSRVGRSDVGANAARIRAFFDALPSAG